ncbi:MAG: DUF3365 domain-containing protein [Nitrospinae bacterium]|nr:DUF3365 domain-containing protein [Nitrospinota bacterium]
MNENANESITPSGEISFFFSYRRLWLVPLLFWAFLVFTSYVYTLSSLKEHSLMMAKEEARSMFQLIQTVRAWNASHGGVLVHATDETPPNKYLSEADRTEMTIDGRLLVRVNPAYMTRQLSEIIMSDDQIFFHITSLKLVNPKNKADDWETRQLTAFEKEGKEDALEKYPNKGKQFYRYMAPLKIKQVCMKCHKRQGYKVGDVRGGISINIPEKRIENLMKGQYQSAAILHVIVFLIVSLFLIFFMHRIREGIIKLEDLSAKQEEIIRERTTELEKLNNNLEEQVESEVEKRREQEQLLIQQSKLASMGDMLGAIAHQWRQPLNSIGLDVQMLEELYMDNELDEKEMKTHVKNVMKKVEFLSNTIDDFRNFYKKSKKKQDFNPIESFYEILSILSEQLKFHFIDITIVNNIEGEVFVSGFPGEFKQALLNLVSNAKDAIIERQEKGEKTPGKIEIIFTKENGVNIKVKDNGGGIAEEYLERIFEPYFSTKEDAKGTGIGLYMSKVIIEKNMGGRVSVENSSHGASFSIWLPEIELKG